jgi:hypothetical protein
MKLHGPRLEFPVAQQVRLILAQAGLIQLVRAVDGNTEPIARRLGCSTERWSWRSCAAGVPPASLVGDGSQEPPCDPDATRAIERASRGASPAPAASFKRRNVDRESQPVRPTAWRRGDFLSVEATARNGPQEPKAGSFVSSREKALWSGEGTASPRSLPSGKLAQCLCG